MDLAKRKQHVEHSLTAVETAIEARLADDSEEIAVSTEGTGSWSLKHISFDKLTALRDKYMDELEGIEQEERKLSGKLKPRKILVRM